MSAVAPALRPYPDDDHDDDHDADRCDDHDRDAGGSGARPATGTREPRRPALTVAGRSATASSTPDRSDRSTAGGRPREPRVRLVPCVEPPATALPATGPGHRRPPLLGSPEALARRPLPAADGDPDVVPGQLPDPTRTCCAIVLAAVEGLRGVRPLAQLTWWVTPEVYEGLALRAGLVQSARVPPAGGRAGIRRVRVFRLGDGTAEATVVVDDGPRVRAVALRVEEHRGRWRATALEIG